MIDASEHFYDDDPGQGPSDVRTRLSGASYFLLGNGLVQAIIQFAPAGEGTPLGLLVMDAERLGKKRDALTMDPDEGLAPTVVSVIAAGERHAPCATSLRVEWTTHDGVPAVRAYWTSGDIDVEEVFFCPNRTDPTLARVVTVRLLNGCAGVVGVTTGASDHRIQTVLTIPGAMPASVTLCYRVTGRACDVTIGDAVSVAHDAVSFWAGTARSSFGDDLLDRLFAGSATQLPAAVSARGRVDGSIWQYNREWVRDQAFLAQALTMAGHRDTAAIILERLLREFVTADGATLDSSEVRSKDEAELDQNGVLLYVLNEYVRWTGDRALVDRWWNRIAALAEYPLGDEFRHPASGMPANTREFWERHHLHGIEPGFELAQVLFVSIGLASAAALARLTGHDGQAARWDAESVRLKRQMLDDPVFRLVDERGFIKRRGIDGRVAERITPAPDAPLPAGVPLLRPGDHPLNPDTCTVLPIVFGVSPADGDIARRTLETIEQLWNQEWTGGGYGRYHAASEADSPGAWPFASIFVARAAVEAGDSRRAWRVLRWLDTVPGAAACSWFEFYGERIAPPFPQVGVIPWMWAELLLLFVHHILGVRPEADGIRIRPRLLDGLTHVKASIPVRGKWLNLEIEQGTAREQFVPYEAFAEDVTVTLAEE